MSMKRRKDDARYLAQRVKLFAGQSPQPWLLVDNWPLFAGIGNIARSLAIYDLLKRVIDLPGHWAELGCWRGSNLLFLAKVALILRPQQTAWRKIIGFDWFKGMDGYVAGKDDGGKQASGLYRGNPALIQRVARLYDLQDDILVVRGDITKSVPAFLKKSTDSRFAFVYVDCDLYAPCKAALEALWPRMLKGGIVVFDEYNMSAWPGETAALHEVLGADVELHAVPHARQPTAYVVKT